jgi:hypothetical protein
MVEGTKGLEVQMPFALIDEYVAVRSLEGYASGAGMSISLLI